MNRFSDDLDDMTLPQRPRRPDPRREGYEDVRPDPRTSEPADAAEALRDPSDDREVTLSTGTVLALFFGLALICAVFFGFGYSMGRRSAPATAATDMGAAGAADTNAALGQETTANKPSAGSPAIQAIPGYLSQGEADAANRKAANPTARAAVAPSTAGTSSVTLPMDAAPTPKVRKVPVDPDGEIVEGPAIPPKTSTVPAAAPAASSTAVSSGGGAIYVQIAAVSHREDADVLLSALKRRGYNAFTRTSDGDRFIHVQVGPFPDKKDAETIRQKLLGDGYNAMLK